jgi:hypothetical protein
VPVTTLAAFGVWCLLFVAMAAKRNPGSVWLEWFAPLMFVFAADHVVNRAWYSKTLTTPAKYSSAIWAGIGILWGALGVLTIVFAIFARRYPVP